MVDKYLGRYIISARVWFRDGDELKAGRQGIGLDIRHLPALAAALDDALVEARALGLINDGADR